MTRCVLVLSLAAAILAFPQASPAADKALPDGLAKAVADLLPPDFAGFPPGTAKLSVEFLCKRGAVVLKAEWGFERGADGALAFRGLDASPAESAPDGMAFPDKVPAEGPMESLKNCLAAIREKSVEKVKRYVPPEAAEAFEGEGAEALGEMEKELAENGLSLEQLARMVPRDGALPARCNQIRLEFRVPAKVKDKAGFLKMEAELTLAAEGAANWVVKDFDPGFDEEEKAPAEAKDPAAPEGLRKLVADFPLPEVGGLPAGTVKVSVECVTVRSGKVFGTEINLRSRDEKGPLASLEIEVEPKEKTDEGLEVPAAPLLESPVDSVRKAVEGLKTLDKEKILRYVPRSEKEEFAKNFEEGLEEVRKMLEAEKAEKGYDSIETRLANLPAALTAPPGTVSLEIGYDVQAEVKGEKGLFSFEFSFLIDDPKLSHFVIKEMDMRFVAPEKETPGEEKGKDGE